MLKSTPKKDRTGKILHWNSGNMWQDGSSFLQPVACPGTAASAAANTMGTMGNMGTMGTVAPATSSLTWRHLERSGQGLTMFLGKL